MIDDNRLPMKEKFLEYFRKTPIQKYGGAFIGRDETTIIRWKDEDVDFANQIEHAKSLYVQQKLEKVPSNEWILERLFKDHFAARTEVTGANGEKLEIGFHTSLKQDDNTDALRASPESNTNTPVQS